jgi:hypothetical protein
MRALRAATLAAGVTVLDHHPAIELLATGDGRIGGARGHALRGREDWEIHARAIILATGGNAFRSGLIGSATNTGDGHLMAAEAGPSFRAWNLAQAGRSRPPGPPPARCPTPGRSFSTRPGASWTSPPRTGHAHNRALAQAMLAGPVLADLSQAPAALRPILRQIQPFTPAPLNGAG